MLRNKALFYVLIVSVFIFSSFFILNLSKFAYAITISNTPNESTWITNGPILAIVSSTSTVYLGGNFTFVGPYTGNGAPISATSSLVVSPHPRVSGLIYTTVSDNSGGWYIGGDFTQVEGVTRNRIAHILSDGSLDPSWNPNAGQTVMALALSPDGSTLYVGGSFTDIGGQSRLTLAALDTTGTGTATEWDPGSDANDIDGIYSIALNSDGSILYVGGGFNTIAGVSRNALAALDTTGTGTATELDLAFGVSDEILSLAVDSTSSIVYAGGYFTSIGGEARNNLAALSTTGVGTTTEWDPNTDDAVYSLAISPDGSTVYAGGSFTSISGESRSSLAALDATGTGTATEWDPSPSGGGGVYTLAVSSDGSTVYAGGDFTSIGGESRNCLAALDATGTGTATEWNPTANSTVQTLALNPDGSTVYVGGGFTSIGSVARKNIAAFNSVTGVATDWNPGDPNDAGDIRSLAISPDGSTVYAGGNFTSIGGESRNYLAALDAVTGSSTAWNPNSNGTVYSIAPSSDGLTVYVGGSFNLIGGESREGIAALDIVIGSYTAWDPNSSGDVYSLVISPDGSTIYAGGLFNSISGESRSSLAALYTTGTGTATDWDPNANASVIYSLAISPDGSTVYAGGNFTSIGGETRNHLAALDTTGTGTATEWDPSSNNGAIYSLAISPDGSTVYAGGDFTSISGEARIGVAALDATGTGTVTDWGTSSISSGLFTAVSPDGSNVYVSGYFPYNPYFAQFKALPVAATPPSGGRRDPIIINWSYGPGYEPETTTSTATSTLSASTSTSETSTTTSTIVTVASLQQQIADLIAQLNALVLQAKSRGLNIPSSVQPFLQGNTKFSRDLQYGAIGEDVKQLQIYLNTHGFPVSSSGPGSSGNETTKFGPATQAVLILFQKANNISPASGYFGPKTRAYVAAHP
jgi:hypothetical protein